MPKNNFGPCPKLVNRNELYAGVLVWNRQRFIKDPNTGKYVSRPNPEA
jgi:site-specific DNA recombinase